jgi:hypothetical protein
MRIQLDGFDLFLVKPDLKERLILREDGSYVPLISYASYGVYLISINDRPKLEGSYLSGKSLGLIADPFSESGNKYPKNIMYKNIKKEELPNFKSIYASHAALRDALMKGEVNLIGSYWGKAQRDKYPLGKFLKIADVPRGRTWFFGLDGHKSEVLCLLAEALKNNAKKRKNEYWKNIIDLSGCNEIHE